MIFTVVLVALSALAALRSTYLLIDRRKKDKLEHESREREILYSKVDDLLDDYQEDHKKALRHTSLWESNFESAIAGNGLGEPVDAPCDATNFATQKVGATQRGKSWLNRSAGLISGLVHNRSGALTEPVKIRTMPNGWYWRHRLISVLSGSFAFLLGIGAIGMAAEATAVADLVAKSELVNQEITSARKSLDEHIRAARVVSIETQEEVAKLEHHTALVSAIEHAEEIYEEPILPVTGGMALVSAQENYDAVLSLLDRLGEAESQLELAVTAAIASHEEYLVNALEQARADYSASVTYLEASIDTGSRRLKESTGLVARENTLSKLTDAIEAAQIIAKIDVTDNTAAYTIAIASLDSARNDIDSAVTAVQNSITEKERMERMAAEKAEAERIAAEEAAEERRLAEQAAAEERRIAEQAAAEERAAANAASQQSSSSSSGSSGGGAWFYKNCTEARAAGAAPVRRGEPGFGPHLDRDNDGIGCE